MPDRPAVEVAPESLADLRRLGDAYKEGDRKFRTTVGKDLRSSATALAQVVIREGSEQEPAAGGLRARLAAARGGVSVALSGRNVSVSIRAKTLEGYALREINRGNLRHPVFGNSKVWAYQEVPEGAYTDVFEKGAPLVQAKLKLAIQRQLAEIAKEA